MRQKHAKPSNVASPQNEKYSRNENKTCLTCCDRAVLRPLPGDLIRKPGAMRSGQKKSWSRLWHLKKIRRRLKNQSVFFQLNHKHDRKLIGIIGIIGHYLNKWLKIRLKVVQLIISLIRLLFFHF